MNQGLIISSCSIILIIVGWYIVYRLNIRLRKKDKIMVIINEIRGAAETYYKGLFPNAATKGFYQSPECEITDKIEEIITKYNKSLGYFQKRKIRKVFIKIAELFHEIEADWDENQNEKKYYKRFYDLLEEIQIYK